MMNSSSLEGEKRIFRRLIRISRDRDYPLNHLETVLLPLFQKDYTEDSLRVTIESANHIWCAYENGQCLGCVLATDIGSHGGVYVILFGVCESVQGLGIGTRMLKKMIKWCRKRRRSFIFLLTEDYNERAIRLYEKAGFEKHFHSTMYDEPLPEHGQGVLPLMLLL
ncbi:unnamed protein product [Adineta ricciae]|uniref:N-acetyltransferase domain-containing protein n=1 Tax=Adineta ricciae TaxID=249248 RepID=A0A813NLQ7_ADIRI|nr:unnamed protein product [Adineta ricciae]CAF0775612.1 unnamed protein product [Adineta ricciae]